MLIEHDPLLRAVEAALFASETPMTIAQIKAAVGADMPADNDDREAGDDIRAVLDDLQEQYDGRGIQLVKRGGAWHFQTAADLAHMLRREKEQLKKLSRAAVETLSIIAYHEPVSRAEIEAIRGVQISKGTLDVLMEAGWVKPAGRRDVPGRPLIYKTTDEFLVHFGLDSRRDLPGLADLKAAGLLDPVDEAFDQMLLPGEDGEAADDDGNGQENGEQAGNPAQSSLD